MRLEEAEVSASLKAMRNTFNVFVFCIVVLAIYDTVTFTGYYRKAVWQQFRLQAIWVAADIR